MFEFKFEIDPALQAGLLARCMDLWPQVEFDISPEGFNCSMELEPDVDGILTRLEVMLSAYEKDREIEERMSLSIQKLDGLISPAKAHLCGGFAIIKSGMDFDGNGDVVCLEVDPGPVFGSGAHPSTGLIISGLEEFYTQLPGRKSQSAASVLDAGTGSGILSLVAANLGSGPVLAIDTFPEAVTTARKNVDSNNLADRINVQQLSFKKTDAKFDLVMANLPPSIVSRAAKHLVNLVSDEGTLLISGFTDSQAPPVLKAMLRARVDLKKSYSREGWSAMCFTAGV